MENTGDIQVRPFTLPNKKVKVMPIKKQRGMIADPSHVAYWLMEGTSIDLCTPRDSRGNLVCPLDKEEIEYFENAKASNMHFKPGDLSPYKANANYWESSAAKVKLTGETLELNLNNPKDYLIFAILKANRRLVAPSWDEKRNRATYLYALVEEHEVKQEETTKALSKMEAFEYLAKIKNSSDKLIMFLKAYGQKPSATADKEWLVTQLSGIIEKDLKGFLRIAGDDLFEMKVFLGECVAKGLIYKRDSRYFLTVTDKPLCEEGQIADRETAVKFIEGDQELMLTLKAQLNANR